MATRRVTKKECEGRRSQDLRRARAGTALTSFDDIRKVAHALPSVVDGTSYGTAALKVGGKLFARLHQSMDCVVLRCELLVREILIPSDGRMHSYSSDHYRDYPWILLRFGVVDKRVLPELIERAWRLVASKTLIKKQDERRLS